MTQSPFITKSRGRSVPEWQPIETAPRDGTPILGYDNGIIRVCVPKLFGPRWEWFRDDIIVPNNTWSIEPSHWMPLPEPPK